VTSLAQVRIDAPRARTHCGRRIAIVVAAAAARAMHRCNIDAGRVSTSAWC
jgi:hypothetical protein